MLARGDQIYTSALTVGEVLVKPLARNRPELVDRYLGFFRRPGIAVLPFDFKVAPLFARIRQDRTLRPPDAIQLACAASAGVDLFITNDARLSQKLVAGINFITSLGQAPI